MTDLLFFDTDCISAFLWVNNQSLLPILYPGRIVIPKPVYLELSKPGISHLKRRLDMMLANKETVLEEIIIGTDVYMTYYQLTEAPTGKHKVIGKGEAASIALAKELGGIVASNNLKDIKSYIIEFGLDHITTGDILVTALQKGLITESQGNIIWYEMLDKRRKIGASSFTEYLSLRERKNT